MERRGFLALAASALGLGPKQTEAIPLPLPVPLTGTDVTHLANESWHVYVYDPVTNWRMSGSFTPPNDPNFAGVKIIRKDPTPAEIKKRMKKPRRRWRDKNKHL